MSDYFESPQDVYWRMQNERREALAAKIAEVLKSPRCIVEIETGEEVKAYRPVKQPFGLTDDITCVCIMYRDCPESLRSLHDYGPDSKWAYLEMIVPKSHVKMQEEHEA